MSGRSLFIFTTFFLALPAQPTGVFTAAPDALPHNQLPHVPLLGNGRIGIALDATSRRSGAGMVGPGRKNTLDIWVGSNSMWSCQYRCNSYSPGCCRVVSLGGASLSLLPTFNASAPTSFYAEQRTASGTLYVNMSSPRGSTFEVIITLHPDDNVATLNLMYTARGGDPSTLALNASVWATAPTRSGNDPHPQSVGCADAACGAGGVTVSRRASDPNTSPVPVWAALALAPAAGAAVSWRGVTSNASGAVWEAGMALQVASGTPATLLLAEAETWVHNASDPSGAAAGLAAVTAPAAVAAAAAAHWNAFWARSGVALTSPTRAYVGDVWYGAQYVLACTSPRAFNVTPAPGLYGVWATSDGAEWSGDYTLDYNQESTYFGAYSSNHPELAEGYFAPILDWQVWGLQHAAAAAAASGISCPNTTLHFGCHLAPWGMQSDDTSTYMHWNGQFGSLLFYNHWEYMRNESFARSAIYPLVAGLNDWFACYFAKNVTDPKTGAYEWVDFRAKNPDEALEGQRVVNPQMALAMAGRTLTMQRDIGEALGIPPPPFLSDLLAHTSAYNTAPWNWSWADPATRSFTLFNNTRCFNDVSGVVGATSPENCLAFCANTLGCTNFSWSYGLQECWLYDAAVKTPACNPGTAGYLSGRNDGPPPNVTEVPVWASYRGASAAQSFFIGVWYSVWPSEHLVSQGAPLDAATMAIAQATSRAFTVWAGLWKGRVVDMFAAAVMAGWGASFGGAPGGSVEACGAPAPAFAFSPAEVLDGLLAQLGSDCGGIPCWGPNLLIYAPGGGVENVGVSAAINAMLLGSVGGVGGYLQVFPFWPASESANFTRLLGKGGFEVSAAFDAAAGRVASPVLVTSRYSLAESSRVALRSPWCAATDSELAVTCGGTETAFSWNATARTLLWDAPVGVDCEVEWSPPAT